MPRGKGKRTGGSRGKDKKKKDDDDILATKNVQDAFRTSSLETTKQVKVVQSHLSQLPQMESAPWEDGYPRLFLGNEIQQHKDDETRLAVCCILADFFRIVAPEMPMSEEEANDAFRFVFSEIKKYLKSLKLVGSSSHLGDRFFYLIENICLVTSYLVLDDDDMIVSLVECVLETSDSIPQHLQRLFVDIINGYLDESKEDEVLSERIIRTLFLNLDSEIAKKIVPHASELVQKILPKLCETGTHEDLEIVFGLNAISSSLLLYATPQLHRLLTDADPQTRIRAVTVIGRMFAMENTRCYTEYPALVEVFCERFRDRDPRVRILMVQWAKVMIINFPKYSKTIFEFLKDRALDAEERIRRAFVTTVAEILEKNPLLVPKDVIEEFTGRTRDKKLPVRLHALESAAHLYALLEDHAWIIRSLVVAYSDNHENPTFSCFVIRLFEQHVLSKEDNLFTFYRKYVKEFENDDSMLHHLEFALVDFIRKKGRVANDLGQLMRLDRLDTKKHPHHSTILQRVVSSLPDSSKLEEIFQDVSTFRLIRSAFPKIVSPRIRVSEAEKQLSRLIGLHESGGNISDKRKIASTAAYISMTMHHAMYSILNDTVMESIVEKSMHNPETIPSMLQFLTMFSSISPEVFSSSVNQVLLENALGLKNMEMEDGDDHDHDHDDDDSDTCDHGDSRKKPKKNSATHFSSSSTSHRYLLETLNLMSELNQFTLIDESILEPAAKNLLKSGSEKEIKRMLQCIHAGFSGEKKIFASILKELSSKGRKKISLADLPIISEIVLLNPIACSESFMQTVRLVEATLLDKDEMRFSQSQKAMALSFVVNVLRGTVSIRDKVAEKKASKTKKPKRNERVREDEDEKEISIWLELVQQKRDSLLSLLFDGLSAKFGVFARIVASKGTLRLLSDPEIEAELFNHTSEEKEPIRSYLDLAECILVFEAPKRVLLRLLLKCEIPAHFASLGILFAALDPSSDALEHIQRSFEKYHRLAIEHKITLDDAPCVKMYPEYSIPYLIFLVAHMHDLNFEGMEDESVMDVDVIRSFARCTSESDHSDSPASWLAFSQKTLELVLDLLAEEHSEAFPFLLNLLERLRMCDDRMRPDSDRTRILCDLATLVLHRVFSGTTPTDTSGSAVSSKGRGGSSIKSRYGGKIYQVLHLFVNSEESVMRSRRIKSFLPPGFRLIERDIKKKDADETGEKVGMSPRAKNTPRKTPKKTPKKTPRLEEKDDSDEKVGPTRRSTRQSMKRRTLTYKEDDVSSADHDGEDEGEEENEEGVVMEDTLERRKVVQKERKKSRTRPSRSRKVSSDRIKRGHTEEENESDNHDDDDDDDQDDEDVPVPTRRRRKRI
eukprot:TRINITY_DN937_c0_g1_i1.p1 TRINITY_DN937_c0_g1~~TRINITY_DN937_c0_g1_i1.p1  ORF type:complete len:1347 (+),score=435.26 TRINITY_DN937_c0_g1_i1:355-4395(+)